MSRRTGPPHTGVNSPISWCFFFRCFLNTERLSTDPSFSSPALFFFLLYVSPRMSAFDYDLSPLKTVFFYREPCSPTFFGFAPHSPDGLVGALRLFLCGKQYPSLFAGSVVLLHPSTPLTRLLQSFWTCLGTGAPSLLS